MSDNRVHYRVLRGNVTSLRPLGVRALTPGVWHV